MLGHANLQQTSTYLNATLRGMHRSMRTFERTRGSVKRDRSSPCVQATAASLPFTGVYRRELPM
jgi:hypothetical protein